jgi:hypothetical protein
MAIPPYYIINIIPWGKGKSNRIGCRGEGEKIKKPKKKSSANLQIIH